MAFKNKILPACAVIGLTIAIVVAVQSQRKTLPAQPVAQPAQAPFPSYLGGAGIVEARTQNISIGTSLPGIVKTVCVNVGDRVKAGAPLFQIDDRESRADLLVKEANLLKAKAAVAEARASLKDYQAQYELVRHATDRRAVSVDDVQKRRYAEELARAKLASCRSTSGRGNMPPPAPCPPPSCGWGIWTGCISGWTSTKTTPGALSPEPGPPPSYAAIAT
jgi:HlyD family secretion protein